jgi:MerR family redox-sensitive transcriptional activator SoxR
MPEQILTIGAVVDRTGVAASALRYYEREGLISSGRSEGGQRRYPREVLRRIAFIRTAQRVGLSLEEVKAAMASLPEGRTPTRADWEQLSRAWRGRLDDQIALLERLRDRLSSCIGCGCLSLEVCALRNPADAAAALGSGPRYLLGDAPVGRPAPSRRPGGPGKKKPHRRDDGGA